MGYKSKREIYVSYTPFTHSLKVILCNILNTFPTKINCVLCSSVLIATDHVRLDVEFSACGIMLMLKKFEILEHFGIQISGLGMLNLYPYNINVSLNSRLFVVLYLFWKILCCMIFNKFGL